MSKSDGSHADKPSADLPFLDRKQWTTEQALEWALVRIRTSLDCGSFYDKAMSALQEAQLAAERTPPSAGVAITRERIEALPHAAYGTLNGWTAHYVPVQGVVDLIGTAPVSAREEWPHGKATNGEIAEEYLNRDEAVWALIDEVRALRRGVGLTHSRDPIEIITDKWWGISSREEIARHRAMIAKAKASVGPTGVKP
jgi:hypothetical protein